MLAALGGAARIALEELMKQGNYEYQSDFAKRYVAQGREEGRDEGRVEGNAEALLTILRARAIEVDDEVTERIRACSDGERVQGWLRRAAHANRLEDVFAEDR